MRLVEVSFEVGNKVGGIHTVLASKSRLMLSLFSPYLAVGYYDPHKSPREFVEETPPDALMSAIEAVQSLGAEVHYGSWLVPGRPKAVLINPGKLFERLNEIKYYYWDWYRVDSLRSDDWFNVPAVWSYAVGVFLHHLLASDPNAVALFHEWLSGGALLYLRRHSPATPTVFHTHATMLGRVLANSGYDLYSMIDSRSGNPDELAYRHGIEAKHLMEKAAAQNAHVFTTVSNVTAREAEFILGRRPDLVLPNGLDMQLIPPMEELSVRHVENEKKINEFVLGYFSPYCNIDVDNTLYFFFSGRYDVHVKGIDVLIDALAILNGL
ncbi:TPA: glycogen synthase, partial [Candidatus Micrarchaeota archaeon]|nr:glycogen synthase [Candidatus Micrarchaeota archaeon]